MTNDDQAVVSMAPQWSQHSDPVPVRVRDLVWEDAGARQAEPLRVAARSVSPSADGRLGGDVWSVASRGDDMLLLVADVRGNGEQAAPLARPLLTVFRTVAKNSVGWDIARTVGVLRDTVCRAAGDEDFVTALVVHATADGRLAIVSCGHPAPLLLGPTGARPASVRPALPLGLGSDVLLVTTDRLAAGERLLLFTDGLSEAHDDEGEFFPLEHHAASLGECDVEVAVDALLARALQHTGGAVRDDLTLLLVAGPAPEIDAGAFPSARRPRG